MFWFSVRYQDILLELELPTCQISGLRIEIIYNFFSTNQRMYSIFHGSLIIDVAQMYNYNKMLLLYSRYQRESLNLEGINYVVVV